MSRAVSRDMFMSARRRAAIQDLLAELSGRSGDLLPFDQVQQRLRLSEPTGIAQLQEIPLDRIVGSVGRYQDFNRAFLPRAHLDPARWTRIDQLRSQRVLPPIDVFKVGEVYFVRDGNHRVSVARVRGHKTIRACVVEIPVRVPLGPDTSVDDLIVKSEYADLLESTSLDIVCPDQHIELTRPGGYRSLLQHIEIHQFYMGLHSRRYPSLSEAAADWYQKVYLPVVERIRASGVLNRFPRRTEADLYLWIAENRAGLQMRYHGKQTAQEAVDRFAQEHRSPRMMRWLGRLRRRRKRPDNR